MLAVFSYYSRLAAACYSFFYKKLVYMYALTKSAISNSYLDLAPYLVMGGYYSSKTDFIRQQIKWFDDYHNPVITDNYGNISRFAFRDPDLIDRQLQEISVYRSMTQLPCSASS